MFHLVARSVDGAPLFHTWAEARQLWDAVVGATPDRIALVLMPNHVHLLHPLDVRVRLAHALSGFTRWWHHTHGTSGRMFAELPPAEPIVDLQKQRRQVRYVHLNPCRARGLASDPLAWPFSTHRDACGLAVPAVVDRAKDVVAFHRYVSSDPHVEVQGTALPDESLEARDPLAVLHAVSAVTRTPLSWLAHRVPARHLYLRAALHLCPKTDRTSIGELVGVGRNGAARAARGNDAQVRAVARAVGDRRLAPLHDRRLSWPAR
jgi:hypothetical protein